MTVTLTMPRLGETMEEGTVTDWLVEEGARFERGAPLVEFETDKTAVEYPALGPGVLTRVLVSSGDVVKLGEPIAEIDLEGGQDWVSGGRDGSTEETGPSGDSDAVIVELPMPRLGETMEEGTIASWIVSEGARFERGDPILEVETDKTVAEYPALYPGELVEILSGPGEVVAVDRPIARIRVAPEHAPQDHAPQETAPRNDPPSDPPERKRPAPAAARRSGTGRATPPARRAARKGGIDLSQVAGTGRRGRVELRDVEGALEIDTPGGAASGALAESVWGPPDGTPVLLVHGFAADRLTLDRLGQGLGKGGLRSRAVDLPGHGATEAEARGFDDLVAALTADLGANPPTHVVAHSLGAAVAVRAVAATSRALSLTLIAPAGLGLRIDGTFVASMSAPASVGETGHLLRRLSHRVGGFSQSMIEQVHRTLSRGRLKDLARDIAHDDRQKIDVVRDLVDLADQIPVRAIVGHGDLVLDWRDALAVSPMIAVHHLPDAGHMPHWDAPDAVRNLLVREFTNV